MKINKLLCGFLMWSAVSLPVSAYQIVATVNDEVISDYDVSARLNMMQVLMSLTPEMANSTAVRNQVVDDLIVETLKLQEAKKKKIDLPPEELDKGITYLEKQNQMPEGSLRKTFKSSGVDAASLEHQIKSELVWLKILQAKNSKAPVVTTTELAAEKAKIAKEVKKPSYLLAEIFIPFDKNEKKARQMIEDIFEKIVEGNSFPELAAQHSVSTTAAQGGDLGWVRAGQLEEAVDSLLPDIKVGQLSKPIRGEKGYYLILMRNKQAALTDTILPAWDVTQMIVSDDKLASSLNRMKQGMTCAQFTDFAKKEGLEGSGSMGTITVDRMPPHFTHALNDAPVGAIKGPVKANDFSLFLMKCAEKEVSILPSDDDIRMRLEMKKVEKQSENMLEKLRTSAVIEKK